MNLIATPTDMEAILSEADRMAAADARRFTADEVYDRIKVRIGELGQRERPRDKGQIV